MQYMHSNKRLQDHENFEQKPV